MIALAVEVSRPLIEARKHLLTVSLPQEAVEVEGDAGRLAQVVSNLLNNSAKYSDDGGRIELTLEATGDEAVVRVSDMGIGIEPSMLPTIFDLFAQVKSSTSRFAEGLGDRTCPRAKHDRVTRWLCASHQRGPRPRNHVRRPFAPRTRAGRGRAPRGQDWPIRAVPAHPRRILVVDDNRDAADSMAILLRLFGHEVRTAYDGQSALALARLQVPEVVICDISMPDMGGLELARHLRQDPRMRDSLLVALSGYAQEEDRRRSQEAGFNAHLAKPVRLESLKALLASEDLVADGITGPNNCSDFSPLNSNSVGVFARLAAQDLDRPISSERPGPGSNAGAGLCPPPGRPYSKTTLHNAGKKERRRAGGRIPGNVEWLT